ncbi:hypothetical protein L2E82_40173 [Cichorium intybus]|uniref:Uncharacterized protein n=1 Tax=Cichorium intybus TaxID=13427 RepID=A0ACB9AL14_CICIN|nr:hypothetical protein L2E82_40173 [Cichorium intybus]
MLCVPITNMAFFENGSFIEVMIPVKCWLNCYALNVTHVTFFSVWGHCYRQQPVSKSKAFIFKGVLHGPITSQEKRTDNLGPNHFEIEPLNRGDEVSVRCYHSSLEVPYLKRKYDLLSNKHVVGPVGRTYGMVFKGELDEYRVQLID